MKRMWPPLSLAFVASLAFAQPTTPEPQLAFAVFKELVEINTVTATGDTAVAAEAMAARLLQAGYPKEDVHVFKPAPRKGNLVARLRGTGARKPIMLLAHIDVVDALPTDWSTDPFKLVEKDGHFYGRGTADNKYMAAAFVANMVRYKREGYRPDRDIILVLEADEETLDADEVGIRWLLGNHRSLIDAEFALNEGGGVGLSNGKGIRITLQTSEKVFMNYTLLARNPGGHSSAPGKENAIYRLAEALVRLSKHEFPVQLNDTTQAFFERAAPFEQERMAKAMAAAVATVNCRVMPGESLESVQAEIVRVVGDEQVAVLPSWKATLSPPSPLNRELMETIERVAADFWPGAPLIPTMIAGGTDGAHLRNAGIPTYGHYVGNEYLYRLVKALAGGK